MSANASESKRLSCVNETNPGFLNTKINENWGPLRNVALKSKKATDWAKIKKSANSVNNMKSKEFLPIYYN